MAAKHEDYFQWFIDVDSGKINACKKIKITSKRLLEQRETSGLRWHYEHKAAANHIEYMQRFCHKPAGRPGLLRFEPFQKAILAALYGFVDDDYLRQYLELFEVISRKNGKTTKAAAIEIDLLTNPFEQEYAPNIYNVATTKDQSGLCYDDALKMVDQSDALTKATRRVTGGLSCPRNKGIIRALTGRTKSKDGLDVHLAVLDEMAAWDDRNLYDLIIQGTGARAQPLLLEITTNNFVRGGVFDSQYNYAKKWLEGTAIGDYADRFLPFIFELDDRSEWEDEDCWIKTNPGLGAIRTIESMRRDVAKAKDDPEYYPTVMVKDFNMIENQSVMWLNWSQIHNDMTFDPRDPGFSYGVMGIDAADTTDLFSACILMMRPGDDHIYSLHKSWITRASYDESIERGKRGNRDGAPFEVWIRQGLVEIYDGNIIDKRVALEWLTEIREKYGIWVYRIGYDPWHMRDTVTQQSYNSVVGEKNFLEVVQGAKTLSEPMRELKQLYTDNVIVDNANPLVEFARSNMVVKTDINGNIQPDKKRAADRIDPAMAELDAWVVLRDDLDNYKALIAADDD